MLFALVDDAKTGQKHRDVVDMNRARRSSYTHLFFSFVSCFFCSRLFLSLLRARALSLLQITSSPLLSLVTANISSIRLLLSLSIWCALPASRKLTVRKKATHRFYCINERANEKKTMGSDTSKSKKRATQLTEDEIQLLLKNTHFNRQQIKEWHHGFLVSSHHERKKDREDFQFLLSLSSINQTIYSSAVLFPR